MDVTIHHLHNTYRLPDLGEETAKLQRQLDEVATDRLGQAWEQELAGLGLDSGAYYFVERLAVDVNLNASAAGDDRQAARGWAKALQTDLRRTLLNGQGVTVFPDRAAFLAAFVDDLLGGRAWERWIYAEFRLLKGQPAGAAVETALTQDSDSGLMALLELARRARLEALLAALSRQQLDRIVSRCLLPEAPRLALPGTLPVWAAALDDYLARRPLLDRGDPSRNLARLYLGLLSERPELGPDVHLAHFLKDLLSLAGEHQRAGRIIAAMGAGDLRAALAAAGSAESAALLPRLARELGGPSAARLLQAVGGGQEAASAQVQTSRFATRFAGIFLLALQAPELYDWLAGCPLPDPPYGVKANWLLYALALECLGEGNAALARRDAGVTFFAGLENPPLGERLDEYLRSLETAEWNPPKLPAGSRVEARQSNDPPLTRLSSRLLEAFSNRLGRFAGSSPAFIRKNFLESQGELLVEQDRIVVRFLTCPLGLVLRMQGFQGEVGRLPWLENRTLELRFD